MVRLTTASRVRLIALLMVAAFSFSSLAVTAAPAAEPAAAAKKKKKKCRKGYKKTRSGKCVKDLEIVKPTKIQLVVAKLRDGKFGATGWAEFPKTTKRGLLKGYWHISNGVGFERLTFKLEIGKNLDQTNFTDTDRKVGITGENMTATLVIQGTQSNAQTLIK